MSADLVAKAYMQAQKLEKVGSLPSLSTTDSHSSFHDLVGAVQDTVKSAVTQSKEAEVLGVKGMAGGADPLAVITKINSVHMTLQMMTTVLNKSIQAWNEVKNQPL